MKYFLSIVLCLWAFSSYGDKQLPEPAKDGFKHPLKTIDYTQKADRLTPTPDNLNFLIVYDPLEGINRRIYKFNYLFDEYVFLPVVSGYKTVTPEFMRAGVSNFFSNIGEVPTIVNSLLQLQIKNTTKSFGRLLINTTFGIFGLFDPASAMGLTAFKEDFGQTLAYWGVGEGPYLVLPFLGPSNLRDSTGIFVDIVTEKEINFLNVASVRKDHNELFALQAINQRYVTPFRYGDLGSPFEYDLVRYLYTEARKLKVEIKENVNQEVISE
ncbi:MlaA family lipoprotein [Zooshikella ganghwensis]|uniref:MlaA family lipoprotein n=1 Tax=Zooshikella ganghwensis TaxID=202772 RepID=UPI00041F794E|nr:VacJ family lipoprotein [Zooshikella ganghwensis]